MHINLEGKVAIVTGGGRGIGRVIAARLAAEGVAVTVADYQEALLEDVGRQWGDNGWTGLQLPCDVRLKDDCRSIVGATDEAFGKVDILVNNAGVARGGRIEELDEADWDANADINLKGAVLMSQAVIPAMKRRKGGRIITASSFAARIPSIGGAAYAASKAGVESFTRVLASELGPDNITVNAYAPGMVPTQMNHFAERPDAQKDMLLDTLSLRRWGDPEDIANLICFLSSDLAAYITGTTVEISGGKFATQMPWLAHRQP